MTLTDQNKEDIKDLAIRKFTKLLIHQLDKYGPEYIANDLNSLSDIYIIPTDEGVREYVSKLLHKPEIKD